VKTTKRISKKLQAYHNKYPFVGPALWISGLQYFITMAVVGIAWPTHYSVLKNTISDLGNTDCGLYDGRYVCSPLHSWMNVSFIILGATMTIGSALIYQEFRESLASKIGFIFMALAGIGTIMVGLFPENSVSLLHQFGAALPFVLGNIALLIFAFALAMPKALKIFTLLCGIASLAALYLFLSHNYLGLGIGGTERLTAHLQTIWLIVFGAHLMQRHRDK
jgi:hypothetical membrane protein